MIRKADIILAVILIVAGLAVTYAFSTSGSTGEMVCITVSGEEYASYSLSENRTVTVKTDDHINKITIKDGNVQMSFSTCKSQDCVKQGTIKDSSKSIICLPHKIVVEIESKESEFDSVSR